MKTTNREVSVNAAPHRDRAPIDYEELRRPYNTARAVAAGLLAAATAIAAVGFGHLAAAPAAIAGLLALVHAWYHRDRGASALPVLIFDVTAIGLAVLASGSAPTVQTAAFFYVVAASMMLLPPRRAALVVGYALVWGAVSVARGGDALLGNVRWQAQKAPYDAFAAVVFLAMSMWVLIAAVQNLLRAHERQEEALAKERRAVALKNEFVSMVSHELRTPLTSIAGFTEALRDSWRELPPSEVEEFLGIMRHETEHLSNLVEDILVIPRLEAGQLRLVPEDLDLNEEVAAVVEIVHGDADAVQTAIPQGTVVHADRTRLRQILRNLIENAAKYGGGQTMVTAEETLGGQVVISVADNGPGVPPEDRERIFEHFEQLSKGDARLQQGVGLGLPIARKLARAMGGDLWYEDRFPVGARFRFTVGLVESEGVDSEVDQPEPVG